MDFSEGVELVAADIRVGAMKKPRPTPNRMNIDAGKTITLKCWAFVLMNVKLSTLIFFFMNVLRMQGEPGASQIDLVKNPKGLWELRKNGETFFIRGLGGNGPLPLAMEIGANSVRTWGIEQLEVKDATGKTYIDRAHQLGLTVCAGIWVEHPRHGFRYDDPAFLEKQRERVRLAVRRYRDHPALLMWGLGNEMEIKLNKTESAQLWKEVEILAKIVKEEDPRHPVLTTIAGSDERKIRDIQAHYPSIDILGINAYSGAGGTGAALQSLGWQKPFVLTEYGTAGHWQVGKTAWGAPLEPTANEKAAQYFATLESLTENKEGLCLGSYAFLWGNKQETTPTWYGMLLPGGEKLPSVDAVVRAWTGKWPANRSPKIESLGFVDSPDTIPANFKGKARAVISDRDGDELSCEWTVMAESSDVRHGGDEEKVPPSFPKAVQPGKGSECVLLAPPPGAYRLFLVVRDGKGGASTANLPFRVQ